MNIFVTGGSGFLGTRLLERLTGDVEAPQIKALVRSEKARQHLARLPLQFVDGSLDNLSDWEHHLDGVDIVVHAAAPVEFWGSWEYFHQNITRATEALLHAAARHGVRRFIYISSESVLQATSPLLDVQEDHPYPSEPNSYYGKAKMLAEQAILQLKTDMSCIILRPTYIYEAGAQSIQDLAQRVRDGKFVWVDGGRTIIESVHVKNVVQAITLACSHGEHQGIYWVTDGRPMPAKDLLTPLLELEGVRPLAKSVPSTLVNPLASMIEALWRFGKFRSHPPLTRFEVSFLAMPRKYDLTKTQRELGYQPQAW
ncbi:NAD-dependent epimerase/dehydratase family protein [Tumebacillus permanentifrigoris]|uniref:Nucleoside-diphosphate-sugar epimerase n=1 Tax=Tumebacillus permanentifrigoris TaxID=378543 RepID=A0A316DBJ2_9BACL|nr:NAD-dependent epimerase/dehydratase family protein [Tumebacillus permanentifrigoris]PWK14946.1 nucleoside-diphosphate-sugar epimerase [Tumebacillus permanentifrigoris]